MANPERAPNSESDNHKKLVRAIEISAPMLMFVAYRAYRHHQKAEDAVQETYLKAFRNIDRFKGDSQMGTWLYRILVNVIKDSRTRERARVKETELNYELATARPDPDADPVAHTIMEEEFQRAVEILSELPPKQRQELLMDMFGFKNVEIAGQLGIPLGTVKGDLHRTKVKLRESWPELNQQKAPQDGEL